MKKSGKLASIALYLLMALSVVFFVIMFVSIDDEKNPCEKARNLMTLNINWAIAMTAIAAAIVVVSGVAQMFSDKKSALRAAGVILIAAVVVGVSYLIASDAMPQFFGVEKFIADGTVTPSISRWISTALNATYIMIGGAALSMIGFGVANLIKR